MIQDFEITDPVVIEFTDGIKRDLGGRLREVWLFGSRARHEARDDSDYDFLIVADCPRSEILDASVEESCAVFDKYGAYIGPVTYDSPLWDRAKESSLGRRIVAEGIKVYER